MTHISKSPKFFSLLSLLFVLALTTRTIAEGNTQNGDSRFSKEAADSYYQKWLNQDVTFIIKKEERDAFQRLSSDNDRFHFIEQFWLRRDPNWLDNKFKVEHYRRIAYANKKFASKVPGWRTDRGMIYILLGPPDQIDSPAPNGKLFSEIWHYHELARSSSSKKVVLEFVDKSRTNDYQLTTDSTVKALLDWINMPQNVVIESPPLQMRFKNLETVLNVKVTYDLLPFKCQIAFMKVTDATVLTTISIQIENKDLTFQEEYGSMLASVQIYGRVTDSIGHQWEAFEGDIKPAGPAPFFREMVKGASYYQKTIPLKGGQYKLEIALKDLNSGNVGTIYESILVPNQK
ncbi:MAG: hypothetical protein DMG05_23615 [Acidobacteria bacterium]|nr:MAG: hypothetical protein DMG05_23615 [Acidobacteriota bacterium]